MRAAFGYGRARIVGGASVWGFGRDVVQNILDGLKILLSRSAGTVTLEMSAGTTEAYATAAMLNPTRIVGLIQRWSEQSQAIVTVTRSALGSIGLVRAAGGLSASREALSGGIHTRTTPSLVLERSGASVETESGAASIVTSSEEA